ncbi:hypothetical protein [Acrocarpospora sp. B8E8]|uniref:hypothetical protein n=1 Tax=Acrocarpospora sp. B8E8 TaxID=3153572 RepID=UPI00325E9991
MDETQPNQSQITKAGAAGWGPKNPLCPITELEVLGEHPSGVQVVCLGYEDGYLYEYKIPKGVVISPEIPNLLHPLFRGRILRAFSEDNCNFLSVWVPIGDQLAPGVDYATTPAEDYETLHRDSRIFVGRLRFNTGWVYRVVVQLGYPWPTPAQIPCMEPTLVSPVIGVDQNDMDYVIKFWVADNVIAQVPRARSGCDPLNAEVVAV